MDPFNGGQVSGHWMSGWIGAQVAGHRGGRRRRKVSSEAMLRYGERTVAGATTQGVRGLTPRNKELLKQRRAEGTAEVLVCKASETSITTIARSVESVGEQQQQQQVELQVEHRYLAQPKDRQNMQLVPFLTLGILW